MTPLSDQAILRSEEFFSKIKRRLEVGKEAYGDKSFFSGPERTIEEIQEELQDVCGWAVILNSKLESLKERIRGLENGFQKTQEEETFDENGKNR